MSDISEKEEYKLECLRLLDNQISIAMNRLKTDINLVDCSIGNAKEHISCGKADEDLLKYIKLIGQDNAAAMRHFGIIIGLRIAWDILLLQELESEKFKLLDEAEKIKAEMWERARATGNYLNEGPLQLRLDEINKRLREIDAKELKIRNGG